MLKWMIAWGLMLLLVLVFLGAADSLDADDDPDELQYHPPDEPSLSLRDISPRGPSQALRRQLPQRGSQGETGGDDDDQR